MPKSTHQVPGRVRSTYAFIKAHRDQYSVQMMCRILGVAVSGYYLWLQQPISNHDQEDARLLRLIRASFVASHGIYGSIRVFLDLREAGETCSKHRVARLMRENNLRALHGYQHPALGRWKAVGVDPESPAAQFTATRLNTAWVTDITYIAHGRDGCIWRSSWICSRAELSDGRRRRRFTASSCSMPC